MTTPKSKTKLKTIDPAPAPEIAALPTECCATCRFYLMVNTLCRRYPPVVLVSRTRQPLKPTKLDDGAEVRVTSLSDWQSVFPPIAPNGWCGEFQAAAKVQ